MAKFAVEFILGDGFCNLQWATRDDARVLVDDLWRVWTADDLRRELATIAAGERLLVAACAAGNPLAPAHLHTAWDLAARMEAALALLEDRQAPHRVTFAGVGLAQVMTCWTCNVSIARAAMAGPGDEAERIWQVAMHGFHAAHPMEGGGGGA